MNNELTLKSQTTAGGLVESFEIGHGWRLSIPPGPAGNYRWAQLDDYMTLPRGKFLWQSPVKLSLEARASSYDLPGTWGFGFWNDPFNTSLGLGGSARRLPALPNAAWFFYGSDPNYLTFNDELPAQGFLAATFQSPQVPLAFLVTGLPFLPFIKWRWAGKILRRLVGKYILQDSILIKLDPTHWHHYEINWLETHVKFSLDGEIILETQVSPIGRGGLVLWIDNQFASFRPNGKVAFGTLACGDLGWLDIKDIQIEE